MKRSIRLNGIFHIRMSAHKKPSEFRRNKTPNQWNDTIIVINQSIDEFGSSLFVFVFTAITNSIPNKIILCPDDTRPRPWRWWRWLPPIFLHRNEFDCLLFQQIWNFRMQLPRNVRYSCWLFCLLYSRHFHFSFFIVHSSSSNSTAQQGHED